MPCWIWKNWTRMNWVKSESIMRSWQKKPGRIRSEGREIQAYRLTPKDSGPAASMKMTLWEAGEDFFLMMILIGES